MYWTDRQIDRQMTTITLQLHTLEGKKLDKTIRVHCSVCLQERNRLQIGWLYC